MPEPEITATQRNGIPSYAKFTDPVVYRGCAVSGCQRQHYAHGMCNPHYQQAYRATRRERARAQQRDSQRRYLANPHHALKHRARRLFRDAVRAGKIVPPRACEWCHEEGPVHGHHKDYAKPYAVEWLCPPCHRAHHVALRAQTGRPRWAWFFSHHRDEVT